VDPILNLERPHCPEGRFLHVPPNAPDGTWDGTRLAAPWWRDESLVAGNLSKRTQVMRIKNVLTNQEHRLEVRDTTRWKKEEPLARDGSFQN